MKTFMKYAVAAALTGALALAAASPSEARGGRNTAAAIGFGAGALVGAAAASSNRDGYYYGERATGMTKVMPTSRRPPITGSAITARAIPRGRHAPPTLGYGKVDYGAC